MALCPACGQQTHRLALRPAGWRCPACAEAGYSVCITSVETYGPSPLLGVLPIWRRMREIDRAMAGVVLRRFEGGATSVEKPRPFEANVESVKIEAGK